MLLHNVEHVAYMYWHIHLQVALGMSRFVLTDSLLIMSFVNNSLYTDHEAAAAAAGTSHSMCIGTT